MSQEVETMESTVQEQASGMGFQAPLRLRAALELSSGITTAGLASSQQLAKSLGMPAEVVQADMERATFEHQAKMLAERPALASFAAKSPENAAIAVQDKTLLDMGEMWAAGNGAGEPQSPSAVASFIEAQGNYAERSSLWGVGASALKTVAKLPGVVGESAYNTAAMGAAGLDAMENFIAKGLDATGLTGGQRTGVFGSVRDWALANANTIRTEYLASDALALPKELQGRLWDNPQYLKNPEYWTHQLGDAANSLAVMLGAGYATGGGTVGASFAGGAMEAGSFFNDLVRDGVPSDKALSAAVSFGVVTGYLNKIGLDSMLGKTGGKSLLHSLRNALVTGGVESGTELAEEPAQAIIEGIVKGKPVAVIAADVMKSLKNVDVIPGSFLLGGGMRAGVERKLYNDRQAARTYADAHVALHAKLEASETKALMPEKFQEALEAMGVRDVVHLPAQTVLELHQSGVDLPSALGMSLEQVQGAAMAGHDVPAPVAMLHARLNGEQMQQVAEVMRPTGVTDSAAEGTSDAARLEEDSQTALAAFTAAQEEEAAFAAEVASLEGLVAQAVTETTKLDKQAAGQGETPQSLGKHLVSLPIAFAQRHFPTRAEQTAFLAKFRAQGMQGAKLNTDPMPRAEQEASIAALAAQADGEALPGGQVLQPDTASLGELYSEKEFVAAQERQALLDSLGITEGMSTSQSLRKHLPWLDAVWGRIDGGSLRETYPDAFREIARNYGVNIFKSRENGGLPVDYLAEDLKGMGLLQADQGMDDLVEMLKTPKDQWTLFQSDGENSEIVGVVTSDIAQRLPLQKAGVIVLTEESVQHIEENHGEQIRGLGYTGVRDFVAFVLSNVDAIYQGNTARKFILVNRQKTPNGQIVARLEFEASGDTYKIITAHPIQEGRHKKLTPLWERAHTTLFQKENPSATRRASQQGQSGDTLDFTTVSRDVKGKRPPRAVLSATPDEYLVTLLAGADLSSMLHETGHIFLIELMSLVASGKADTQAVADLEVFRKWLGVPEGAAITVDQHEHFADGFMAWLQEGKAPVQGLEGLFGRFARWLTAVYKKAIKLEVPLTDEVRAAMGRMLATETDIAETAAVHELYALTKEQLDALGLTGAERAYAANLMEAAKTKGVVALATARNKQRKERLAAFKAEATEALQQQPVYQVRHAVRQPGGHLDLESIEAFYGPELAQDLRRKVGPQSVKKDGVDPEILAAQHGFESGAAMLAAMVEATPMGKAVATMAEAREAQHEQAIDPLPYLVEAEEAVRQVEMVGEWLARALGKDGVQRNAFSRIAQEQLLDMDMKTAMGAERFGQALRRALRAERAAIAKGDFAAALEANHKARLNVEFLRLARHVREDAEKTGRAVKRFVAMKKADPDARFIVADMAARHGLGVDARTFSSLREGRDPGTIRAWVGAKEAEGYALTLDETALLGPGAEWQAMPLRQFEALGETAQQIIAVERHSRKLATAKGKADLEACADGVVASILAHRTLKEEKSVEPLHGAASKVLHNLHAIHTKTEVLCLALDGGKNLGAAWRYIFKPIADADNKQAVRFKTVRQELQQLFGVYSKKELAAMQSQRVLVPAVEQALTKQEVLCVALNLGNEANKSRVRDGHGWTDAQISQGGGSTKDLARVQRGGELLRLTTMFYSYFNTFYNLGALRISELKRDHSPAAIFRAANTALLLWFIPAVLTELAAGRGPDDDEEPLEWGAMQIAQYPFNTVVGVRDVASALSSGFGYQITPAQSAPASMVRWLLQVNKALAEGDADGKKLALGGAEAAGYLARLPLKQAIITTGNMWDFVTGDEPDFYMRDLFFTKPKSRR